MLLWFVRFPEFAEFTEFPFHVGKLHYYRRSMGYKDRELSILLVSKIVTYENRTGLRLTLVNIILINNTTEIAIEFYANICT